MSATHPPKLDYATPRGDRGHWAAMLERLAYGSTAPFLPAILGTLALASSITLAPRLPPGRALVAGTLLVVAGLLWLILLALRGIVSLQGRRESRRSRRARVVFAAFPVLVLVGLIVSRAMVVPRLAAWISTPGAQRLGLQPAAVYPNKLPDQRIGLFHATDIEPMPGGVTFTVGQTGLFGVYGYCYTEAGNPRPPIEWQGPAILHHLGGNWWLWEWAD